MAKKKKPSVSPSPIGGVRRTSAIKKVAAKKAVAKKAPAKKAVAKKKSA